MHSVTTKDKIYHGFNADKSENLEKHNMATLAQIWTQIGIEKICLTISCD